MHRTNTRTRGVSLQALFFLARPRTTGLRSFVVRDWSGLSCAKRVVSRATPVHAATSTHAFASIAAFVQLQGCMLVDARLWASPGETQGKIEFRRGEARPRGKERTTARPPPPTPYTGLATTRKALGKHGISITILAWRRRRERWSTPRDIRAEECYGAHKARNDEKGLLPWCHTRLCLVVFPSKPF